jgi:3-oxoacyl-[acyl-carrier-protein] synthase III
MKKKNRFESIGVYTPEKIVSTSELIGLMKKPPVFDLESLTGIKNRRHRSEQEDSFSIAMNAARECLKNSSYKAEDIDVIIYSSISRFKDGFKYIFEPSFSAYIRNELGAKNAMNFDIMNACAGMLTGAHILDNMISSGLVRNGMVISGECISPITDTAIKEISKPIDEQFASLTVGDAGAAFIMEKSPDGVEGIDFIEFYTLAEWSHLCLGMPSDKNEGVAMYTNAIELHSVAIKALGVFLKDISQRHKITEVDYDYAIPHQTSMKAIQTGMKTCRDYFKDLPEILYVLQDYGNTASTSHFVVMYRHLKERRMKKDARVFLLSQASGIVMGFVSMHIKSLEV